jgi:methylthioribose-1-phosphate isomerase
MSANVKPIVWTGDELHLLDQRLLPGEVRWVRCNDAPSVAEAIRSMVVRGAPAIGVCAAFGFALAARRGDGLDEAADTLLQARPTAVNLRWAIERMRRAGTDPESLVLEAQLIFDEDVAANRRIGQYGQQLLGDETTVLTHCNAGALATAGYGTALGVVRAASEAGKKIAVYADETRPYLQGARLTAWELREDGIDVTLITDSMAGHFFQQRTFDAVIVGADRIAANGDTANKIGTYTVAVLARRHGVPFYVAAPISTFDPRCPTGADIPIEERSAREVVEIGNVRVAPEGVPVRHPAFDITPASLVTAFITERGVLRPPFGSAIAQLTSSS